MTQTQRYSTVAITLHWLIAVLIIVMIFAGWRTDDMRQALLAGDMSVDPQTVAMLFNWHKTIGLLILTLSIVRLVWRLTHKQPSLPEGMNGFERFAATATHWAFYVLIIGMPLFGWIAASASSFPSYFLNMESLPIPQLVGDDEALYGVVAQIHSKSAWAILGLLALHIAAALKHHFIDRDDVLTRMVVFLKPRG
ncbi:cytochrome b [Hyphobacterium sp.]|uniref:cytochrome b n=1 Tax=Hyphobacterium sp. TaxID=2004662 RepID=UPI0037493017